MYIGNNNDVHVGTHGQTLSACRVPSGAGGGRVMVNHTPLPELAMGPATRAFLMAHNVPLDQIPLCSTNVIGYTEVLIGLRRHRENQKAAGYVLPIDPVWGRTLREAVLPPLREYQRQAVNAFVNQCTLQSGIIHAPPGFGKTFTSMHIASHQQGAVMILTPTTIARDQWVDVLRTRGVDTLVLGRDDGFVWGGVGAVVSTYHIVASRHKLSRDLAAIVARALTISYGTLILDEVHVVPAPTFSTVCETVFRRITLGCTATLVRSDDRIKDLHDLVGGPVRFEASREDLAATGFFATVEHEVYGVPMDAMFLAKTHDGEYNRRILNTLNPEKLACALAIIIRHKQKTIVFCDWMQALQPVVSVMGATGEDIFGPLSGITSHAERKGCLDRFRSAPRGVLVISRVGELALDIPDAEVCIQLSCTKSIGSAIQREGRVTRHVDGKQPKNYIVVTQGSPEAQNVEGILAPHESFELDAEVRARLLDACRRRPPPTRAPAPSKIKKRRRLLILRR